MQKRFLFVLALGAVTALVGCQTTRGVHYIPEARDYQSVEQQEIDEAKQTLKKAQRVGAQHYAAYDYYAGTEFLALAKDSRKENDRLGEWDWAALALKHGQAAVAAGGIPDGGEMALPESREACEAEFNRLKARYEELDAEKAKWVAPLPYAFVVTRLSHAEHELNESRHWEQAAQAMRGVEAAIDTIWSQDVDEDTVVDMKDGAPWAPEDHDGFEDADGIPDLDNDQDGIRDFNDLKINDPETANRWHDYDGAPDAYPAIETIHYASGSAAISSETKGYLRALVIVLDEWPEVKLHIAGHTDIVHTEPFNEDLSARRAKVVHDYLVSQGANPSQLVVTNHGESMPVADNNTAAGKAKNRRVELMLE